MRVNTCKTIDVECEVDVSLDDCITEMLAIADEDGMPRSKLNAIDGATKILEAVTPEMVREYLDKHPGMIAVIGNRLGMWIEEWRVHMRLHA